MTLLNVPGIILTGSSSREDLNRGSSWREWAQSLRNVWAKKCNPYSGTTRGTRVVLQARPSCDPLRIRRQTSIGTTTAATGACKCTLHSHQHVNISQRPPLYASLPFSSSISPCLLRDPATPPYALTLVPVSCRPLQRRERNASVLHDPMDS